jgi:glycine cleavage system H protein
MNNPNNLKYTATHEWARLEADGMVVVGITDHAQEALGDMVFVELPSVGRELKANEECAVVESVKAASDIYAPIAGSVTEVNNELNDAPEKINQDPYGAWIFKLKPVNAADMNGLLDADAYEAQVDSEG